MQVQVTVRKWGNSLGVTLPRQLVEAEGIRNEERLVIEVNKKKMAKVKDLLGLAQGWQIDAQKMKDAERGADLERDRKISGQLRNH
ncbi:MAG: AbrB/MazE/SpoVT family DNA-binding domain-containing protein [Candidatus Diapherotrites archaeon]|nr:AbrB/MazE/SpoVT family DNA-binding domain-containing protein [Candidatus Diapherotrites archaeon]